MKRACRLLLLSLLPVFAFSLEVREGRLKLTIQESSGRFSLYYLTDIQKDKYEPLFVDKDPRTSFAAVLLDDRAYRLGETTAFRVQADRTETGARIVFDSSSLSITETFSFARLSGSSLADALKLEFSALNKSDRELEVGVRFVVDTNLGEKKSAHFRTDRREILSETVLSKSDKDAWWVSENDTAALMGSISVEGYAAPDMVHFANWKRLNDAPWKTQANEGRNFNLLPYSIGDSAVGYYFDPAPLARGAERKMTVFLGAANPSGFAGIGATESDGLSNILKTSVDAAAAPDLLLQTDLITVRDVLNRVDLLLKNPSSVTNEEIAALEAVIVRLKERNPTK